VNERNIPSYPEGPDRLLYQKVQACQHGQADALFDDDQGIIALVKQHLPHIAVFSL